MKCLAKIEQFPAATREKTTKVFIMSADEFLNNQKLINWRSSGELFFFRFENLIRNGVSHVGFVFIAGSSRSSIQLLLFIIPFIAALFANVSFKIMS